MTALSLAERAAERRAHRAAVAQTLWQAAPAAARAVGWRALDEAPAWLALPDAPRALLARRVGAVLAAPALRLWIAAAPLAAARSALGGEWFDALLARADWPAWPAGVPALPPAQAGSDVAELLRQAGASVLAASLPHGALRHAASACLAPLAPLALPAAAAQAVVDAALSLEAETEGVA